MIRTHLIPTSNNVQVKVEVPDNYIGKKVEVTVFLEEEVQNGSKQNLNSTDISKFEGILSEERANEFQKFAEQIRNEWDREI